MSDIEVPDAIKGGCVSAARGSRAIKGYRGTVGISGHSCRVANVLQSKGSANIHDIIPGGAMVVRCCDKRGAVRVRHRKVDAPGIVNPNGRITGAGCTVYRGIANVADFPGYPIVF